MAAIVLLLALGIGYELQRADGYTATVNPSNTFGSGQLNALKHGEYIVYGADYVNSYSSLSCGTIQYPIINRIPLLGFYHQESYSGRPTATHLSVPETKEYNMLGSQSIVGSSGSVVDSSELRGDSSVVYFQNSYVASFLTGFNGDTIKDSKALNWLYVLFNDPSEGGYYLQQMVTDESDVPQNFSIEYVTFTDIEGKTLRLTTQHTADVLHVPSTSKWSSSNTITLNGLDGFQDNYFFKSFRVLDGIGSITAEIDRGDIILSVSTLPGITNDKIVNVYPDAVMGPFNMIDSNSTHIPELHLRYWAVNESAELEDLFTHTGADDWTQLYILKPIYVINGPIVLDDTDLIIPNYAWSNVGFVQCEHSAYNPGYRGIVDPLRSQFAETTVSPVDCQDTLAIALPANPYVNAISATMEDLIPHDFCSEHGNSSPTNQPIDIEIPDIPTGTMYSDYVDYHIDDVFSQGMSSVYFVPNDQKFPDGATFVNSTGGTDVTNVCMGETSYSQQATGSKGLGGGGALFVSVSLARSDNPSVFDTVVSYQDTLNVSCNNLAIKDTLTGAITQLGSDNKQFGAQKPYYLTMIESINNNDFGWGTFQSSDVDSTQPNQYVMGMPFIMVLALLSAFSGFNGRYIIPSIIVYLILISSFTYLEIISLTDALLSGLVMIGIIAIFSKGFR